jgi:Flp pilus assembly protein TadB
MTNYSAVDPSGKKRERNLGLPDTRLEPSGDFARLALREIDADQYGRSTRWSDTDDRLDAYLREWGREVRLREFRGCRQVIFKQAILHGRTGLRTLFFVLIAALAPVYFTAPAEVVAIASVVVAALAVWLVRASYRRRREAFVNGDASIRNSPVSREPRAQRVA